MVRCAHYPQTSSFLDACDELGLLVWEESPGWQYVGDSDWQDQAADDIEKMILRDRHRPSIVVWGARLNETQDRPKFYARTEALVKALDPTRASTAPIPERPLSSTMCSPTTTTTSGATWTATCDLICSLRPRTGPIS